MSFPFALACFTRTSTTVSGHRYNRLCNMMSLHSVVLCVLQNLRANQAPGGGPAADGAALPPGKEPEVTHVTFNKVNGSMGLSIVAAKVSHVFLSQSACVQKGRILCVVDVGAQVCRYLRVLRLVLKRCTHVAFIAGCTLIQIEIA